MNPITGNPIADQLLVVLHNKPEGILKRDAYGLVGLGQGQNARVMMADAIQLLQRSGLVRVLTNNPDGTGKAPHRLILADGVSGQETNGHHHLATLPAPTPPPTPGVRAPGQPPEDLSWIPLPELIVRYAPKDPIVLTAAGVAVAGLLVLLFVIEPHFPLFLRPLFTLGYVSGAVLCLYRLFMYRVERPVLIYLKDHTGTTYLDEQLWSRLEERRWPDRWRRTINGKRTLWLDAQDARIALAFDINTRIPSRWTFNLDQIYPFTAWLAPLPIRSTGLPSDIPQDITSTGELANAWVRAAAARSLLNTNRNQWETLKQGLIIAAIAGCLFMMFLGGSQVTEIVTGEAQRKVELRYPKPTPIPVQPLGQAPPLR